MTLRGLRENARVESREPQSNPVCTSFKRQGSYSCTGGAVKLTVLTDNCVLLYTHRFGSVSFFEGNSRIHFEVKVFRVDSTGDVESYVVAN
jgi:hypothetical protein